MLQALDAGGGVVLITHPAIEAIILGANRIDATMGGLGRGAGNCHMELLLGFLRNPKFRLRPIIRLLQDHIEPLKTTVEWGPFVIAKSALKALTLSLAAELGPRGVRVNMISPGMTETEGPEPTARPCTVLWKPD